MKKRVVIVICDGLRGDMVTPEYTPNLDRIARYGARFTNHRGVFPSTTRTTAAAISTGCLPARNGLEGNAVALDFGQGYEVMSVGPPGFRDKMFEALGRTLKVPTLSERVGGDAVIFGNASPGAAMFLDPDGHGELLHRDVAFGPGRQAIATHDASHDAAGDAALTTRFIEDVLLTRKPALALLWQCEPDHTQHDVPMGSPAHLDVVRAADAQAGRVFDCLWPEIQRGEVLLICASDHGHETVSEIVDLEQMLIDGGFKSGPKSSDVAVAPQGLSATVYLSDEKKPKRDEIAAFIAADPRISQVIIGEELADFGLDPDGGIDIAVVGKTTDAPSSAGLAGSGVAFQGDIKIANTVGCGQHGGLGKYEQMPFLICVGQGFAAGSAVAKSTSPIDIAPTALRHLGLNGDDMDGWALQS